MNVNLIIQMIAENNRATSGIAGSRERKAGVIWGTTPAPFTARNGKIIKNSSISAGYNMHDITKSHGVNDSVPDAIENTM